MHHNVFNVWPKMTLLPVWPRDAERLDTLAGVVYWMGIPHLFNQPPVDGHFVFKLFHYNQYWD